MATVDRQKMLSKEKLSTIFKLIDTDGSGFIEMAELKAVLNASNEKDIDDEVWGSIIKEVDTDGDGTVRELIKSIRLMIFYRFPMRSSQL